MSQSDDKLLAAALSRLDSIRRREAFDPNEPDSIPTVAQGEVISDFGVIPIQWIAAANRSGKSATCGRNIGWALTDSHPTWRMPPSWKQEGMLIVVAARTGKHIEESLWPKIKLCLDPGSYKEVRIGNILQRVELTDGSRHRLVFQSLENPNIARERLQSYDAHIAWLDELVDSPSLITELSLRVTTKGGMFMASFTPLIPAPAVKKMVDSASLPLAKKYVFKTLDNPVFKDERKKDLYLASLKGLSPGEIRTRLEGEWAEAASQVYYFDFDSMTGMPPNYSRLWRHVEAVDPALSSALGLTVWAEDPSTNMWYCVLAKYVKDIYVPTDLIAKVKEITKDFNIVKRISDPHEVWYIQQAAKMGINYIGVYKKNDRKPELIKQYQAALGTRIKLVPISAEDLINETQECRWSDKTEGKIVSASSYHLLDSAQYFTDNIPKAETVIISSSHQEWLYKANEQRKQVEQIKKDKIERLSIIKRRTRWSR